MRIYRWVNDTWNERRSIIYRGRKQSQKGKTTFNFRVNSKIRAEKVRIIDDEGTQLGIMSVPEALAIAEERTTDLVEVAPQADPPVCRLMDLGKFKYQLSKREQAARKKQHVIVVKEVKLRPKTDEHDYQFKLNHIKRFLESGKKAKVTVRFRGREMAHIDRGQMIMDRLMKDIEEVGKVESKPQMEGRNMIMILTPLR